MTEHKSLDDILSEILSEGQVERGKVTKDGEIEVGVRTDVCPEKIRKMIDDRRIEIKDFSHRENSTTLWITPYRGR